MKRVGQIIELDPAKKYIFIFDRQQVDVKTIVGFMDAVINKPGVLALALPKLDSFLIVEHGDRVADVIGKGNFKQFKKKLKDQDNENISDHTEPQS